MYGICTALIYSFVVLSTACGSTLFNNLFVDTGVLHSNLKRQDFWEVRQLLTAFEFVLCPLSNRHA